MTKNGQRKEKRKSTAETKLLGQLEMLTAPKKSKIRKTLVPPTPAAHFLLFNNHDVLLFFFGLDMLPSLLHQGDEILPRVLGGTGD